MSAPPLKRINSAGTDTTEVDGGDDSAHYHLRMQNKMLNYEIKRSKNILQSVQKELGNIKGQNQGMQSLVSLIQRSWKQLDTLAGSILESSRSNSTSTIAAPSSSSKNDMEHSLLSYAMQISNAISVQQSQSLDVLGPLARDPTDLDALVHTMQIDEFSSSVLLEAERKRVEELIQTCKGQLLDYFTKQKDVIISPEMLNQSLDLLIGPCLSTQLQPQLQSCLSQTQSLITNMCQTMKNDPKFVDAGMSNRASSLLMNAENAILIDRITTLTHAVIRYEFQLYSLKIQLRRIERDQLRQQCGGGIGTTVVENPPTTTAESGNEASVGNSVNVTNPLATISTVDISAVNTASKDKVDVEPQAADQSLIHLLQKQLEESEVAKAAVENELTTYLSSIHSQSISPSDASINAKNGLLEQLKQTVNTLQNQYKALIQTHATLQIEHEGTIASLEAGHRILINGISTKINEATKQMKQTLDAAVAEKTALSDEMIRLKSTIPTQQAQTLLVQEQMDLYQNLKTQFELNQSKIQTLTKRLSDIQQQLQTSQTNEQQLELQLKKCIHSTSSDATLDVGASSIDLNNTAGAASKPSKATKAKKGAKAEVAEVITAVSESNTVGLVENLNASSLNAAAELVYQTNIQRNQALQSDLQQANSTIDDLILEMDALSKMATDARQASSQKITQAAALLSAQEQAQQQIATMASDLSSLYDQQSTHNEKYAALLGANKQQEAVVAKLIEMETRLRADLTAQKQHAFELEKQLKLKDIEIQSIHTTTSNTVVENVELTKRNTELANRCHQLSGKLETERKLRMIAQKETKMLSKASAAGGNTGAATGGSEETNGGSMLDMTLSMLRCSVCRDRFKEVAITRCFHLFCKECIDTNLANRHRKCPACGEKFGADDVRQVYFSN